MQASSGTQWNLWLPAITERTLSEADVQQCEAFTGRSKELVLLRERFE